MAQPPKTPAPPRRKSTTGRQTTRGRPRKTPAPAADTTGNATGPASAEAPARRKPGPRPKSAGTATTRVKAAAGDTVKTVRRKATSATDGAAKAASKAAHAVTDSAPAQFVSDTREKMGDRNFFAALVGGVAAVGAAVTGIVLALREGNPDNPANKGGPKKK